MNLAQSETVRIVPVPGRSDGRWEYLRDDAIPPRSTLYRLAPRGLETVWVEGLTSYINRLGWTHRISTRALITQEVVPRLQSDRFRHSPNSLGGFARTGAISLNSFGSTVDEWVSIIEQLTSFPGLDRLTWNWWLKRLPSRQLLRATPAWCPACYAEWSTAALPLYQPLLWTLQCVTMCLKHHCWLETECPHCHKLQSVFVCQTAPGYCTQCNGWLGRAPEQSTAMQEIDATMASWQAWVFEALEELHIHRLDLAENLPWEQFFTHFFACLHTSGSYTTLSRLTGIDRPQLYDWMRGTHTPSFATLLEICYICQVTPWQVITNDIEPLVDTLQSGASSQSPRQPRTLGKVDYEACLKKLQDVLEGREEMMSMRQIAKHLGCHTNMIKYHFPKEYTLVVNRAKVHRQQRKEVRIAQVCAEVRQAVHTLHHRGETLSHSKIRALLTDPNVMRMPEAREAWREAKRELGIEVR